MSAPGTDLPSQVLLFRSSSLNFPIDIEPELQKAGYLVTTMSTAEAFITSTVRLRPFVTVVEIGTLADIDRALTIFEWNEHMQPLAPARFLLLMGSKHLSLGDKADRFRSAEIAALPQPIRNILFKVELQQRLVRSATASAATAPRRVQGFVPKIEELGGEKKRVLLLHGQNEKSGSWKNTGLSPSGKVRWRWVKQEDAEKVSAAEAYSWLAEGESAPRFEPTLDAWVVEGEENDVLCTRDGQEVFSALASLDPGGKKAQAGGGREKAEKERRARELAAILEEAEAESHSGEMPIPVAKAKRAPAETVAREPLQESEKMQPAPRESKEGRELSREAAPRPEKKPRDPAEAGSSSAAEPRREAEPRESAGLRPSERGWNVSDGNSDFSAGGESFSRSDKGTADLAARKDHLIENATAALRLAQQRLSDSESPQERGGAKWGVKDGVSIPATPSLGTRFKGSPSTTQELAQVAECKTVENKTAEKTLVVEHAPVEPKKHEPPVVAVDLPEHLKLDPFEKPSLGEALPTLESADSSVPAERETKTEKEALASIPAALRAKKTPIEEVPGGATRNSFLLPAEETPSNRAETRSFSSGTPLPSAEAKFSSGKDTHSLTDPTRLVGVGTSNKEEALAMERGSVPSQARQRTTLSPEEQQARLRELESSRQFLKNRLFHTMTLAELGDKESSWHPVGSYRIYLAAQHRYFGLKDPTKVLPLWVYEGELAPEFLDELGAWKFYDRLPQSVSNLDSLPLEVLEQIFQMCGLPVPPEMLANAIRKGGRSVVLIDPAELARKKTRDPYAKERIPRRTGGVWGGFKRLLRRLLGEKN